MMHDVSCLQVLKAQPCLQILAEKLKNEKRALGAGRKWKTNFNRLNTQLLELEDDHTALEMVYPQASLCITICTTFCCP